MACSGIKSHCIRHTQGVVNTLRHYEKVCEVCLVSWWSLVNTLNLREPKTHL